MHRHGLRGAAVVVQRFDLPPHRVPERERLPGGVASLESVLALPGGREGCVLRNTLLDVARAAQTVLERSREQAVARMRDAGFMRRHAVVAVYSAQGHRAYLRGANEVVLPPRRGLVPMLARDPAAGKAEAERAVAEAQVGRVAAPGRGGGLLGRDGRERLRAAPAVWGPHR